MEVGGDKDDEIILKLPVPPVKEDTQKTPTSASPGGKRPRKRKSKQWSRQRSVHSSRQMCCYKGLLYFTKCSDLQAQTRLLEEEYMFGFPVRKATGNLTVPFPVLNLSSGFIGPSVLLSLWNSGLTTTKQPIGAVWTVCSCVSKPLQNMSGFSLRHLKLEMKSREWEGSSGLDFHMCPGAEEESEMTHSYCS